MVTRRLAGGWAAIKKNLLRHLSKPARSLLKGFTPQYMKRGLVRHNLRFQKQNVLHVQRAAVNFARLGRGSFCVRAACAVFVGRRGKGCIRSGQRRTRHLAWWATSLQLGGSR